MNGPNPQAARAYPPAISPPDSAASGNAIAFAPAPEGPAVPLTGEVSEKSYGTILKSSALVGGSAVFNILFGIIRAKVMALLLGAGGYGLLGIFSSIADLARSVAGLGINSSGVRQIAEAVGSGDTRRIACTVTTLRRVALYSGATGALLLVAFCHPIAAFSFKSSDFTWQVALLALVAFFGDISAAQSALVQGMRRIADLAKLNVLGAFYGTVFSILIVWRWKEQGIVPALICVAAMSIVSSWWYARKIKVEPVRIGAKEVFEEASELVKLGVAFMTSTLSVLAAGYLIRIILMRQIGAEAAGYYNAAWTAGTLYIGFILQAMGADFFPRLTAVARRHDECNRLVNEQSEVALLMAAPGIMGTLTYAPVLITIFYSRDFGPAAPILQWLGLGMLIKVIAWPLGFIILAKGEKKIFFWSEVLTSAGYIGGVWFFVKWFGVVGAGIAFFALYVGYFAAVYLIARRLTGFRFSPAARRIALIFLPLVAIVFAGLWFLPRWQGFALGVAVTVASGFYSMKTLSQHVPMERLPRSAQKLFRLLGLRASNPIES
ncbi:MAG TPA: O-antigen translocase [Verrucomicrobiae bacterium]|nr:O-antigen translocase [Verrucomicrobiae bacterium]